MQHVIERNLHEIEGDLRVADLLLFRGKGVISRLISAAGRSPYTHAAKVDKWGNDLMCCEVREFVGGRIVSLASQVMQHAGRIDIFRANPSEGIKFNRLASAQYMRQFAGHEYGYWSVLKTSLQHLPVARLAFRHDYTKENGNGPPYCSQACAMADHLGGGADPVPNLADRFTLPGDLARSSFYRYAFTLMGV